MVKLNGQTFILYETDTPESIIDRIAKTIKTLPKYLYFKNNIPIFNQIDSNYNIEVEDLLAIIKSKSNQLLFNELYNEIDNKLNQNNLNLLTDILEPFIAFNTAISAVDKSIQGSLRLVMQTDLNDNNIFTTPVSVDRIWERAPEIRANINNNIKNNDGIVDKQLQIFNILRKAEELTYTDFELERSSFELFLDIKNISIIELFNYIQLHPNVPFASINNLYKILKDFIPNESWGGALENVIVLRILQLKNNINVKFSDYSNAFITISGEPGKELVTAEMSLDTSGQNISRDEFIQQFIQTFPDIPKLSVTKIDENRVSGSFYFPQQTLDKYVFADIVLNNPLFLSMVAIDERGKATKEKGSVYIYFKSAQTGYVTANLTEKIAEKGDPVLKGKDIINLFKYGSTYIRVKINRATNIDSVKQFQILLSKLLYIYNNEYSNIVDFYKNYLPLFPPKIKKDKVIKIPTNLKLKDIAPEVFVKNYPPKCPKQPTIITDDEVEQAEANGQIVMRYPKDDEPIEGVPARNYICNHDKAIYPGLRDNPLSNMDLVPYLPCCFVTDHSKIDGRIYRHYYNDEPLKTGQYADQQDFIITNKFVEHDKYGTLPNEIIELIRLFDTDETYMYLRKGVFDTKSSFLDCVVEGMYEETKIFEKDLDTTSKRLKYLTNLRKQMATVNWAAACKQEMYDFTTEEILKIINDSNIYLNPNYFTSLLEIYFNCNIYVFTRKGKTTLSIPRHMQAYYKTAKKRTCIFIYQHIGSKSDHAQYNRCELIVKWKKGSEDNDDIIYNSNYNSSVCKGIRQIFNDLKIVYTLNIKSTETIFPIQHSTHELTGQGIDSYGKCRMLRMQYYNDSITLLTDPIAPLPLIQIQDWIVTQVSSNVVLQFAQDFNIKITHQNISNNMVHSYSGKLGNVVVTIPVISTKVSTRFISYEQNIYYPTENISSLQNYNFYKKLSRYIIAYMLWLYSKYLKDSKETISIESMNKFQEKYIIINPEFIYDQPVGKIFTMNSGIMQNNKLVLKSEETLKRLMYVLRINTRNQTKTFNYYKHDSIENYYEDITDFDQYQFQVILEGNDSVVKWIDERKRKYELYDSIQLDKTTPYFFKNNLISKNIWIAQNTLDMFKAVKIAQVWNKHGYNPGNTPEITEQLELNFTLYSYANNKDIEKYSYGDDNSNIHIIGYKIDNEASYTTLLPL